MSFDRLSNRSNNKQNKQYDLNRQYKPKVSKFDLLIDEWNDTKNYFSKNKKKMPLSIKYDNSIINIPENNANNENDDLKKPIIEIINEDSFNLAIKYVIDGHKPLVLNMASDYKPGGGVASGKTAQEEELFRRSNAHLTHPNEWYPLNVNETIYSPQVTIIKDSRDKKYKYIDEIDIALISCAAIRKPALIDNKYTDNDYNIMYNKIESIFKIAIIHGHDSLVLGALGCGVFNNPPEEIANMFSILINKYGKHFTKIGFAILVVKDKDTENLNVFKKNIA